MKFLGTLFLIIITSLFYFPFNTSLLPAVNTKMALAAVGLILFASHAALRRNATIDNTFASVSIWALFVSFIGLISAIVNDSGDYAYANYIVSAWVWMGGAYAVVKSIGVIYGKVTLRLLTNILLAVCITQCFLSLIIDANASFAEWVDSFMVSTGFMGKAEGRLYGIGCALDVAGLKFCAVLILLAYFALNPSRKINIYLETLIYVASFFIIAILGSMIARTTSIGVIMVIVYWIGIFIYNKTHSIKTYQNNCFGIVLSLSLALLIPAIIYFYKVNAGFSEDLRFGFEGFFSLVEKGEWYVHSNNSLMGMWIWPDNLATWLIGDGYFNSPDANPYYTGPFFSDYYMGTDIGYCRFVFYFGLIGLAVFCAYFIHCVKCCSDTNPQYRILFGLILLMNFIGWMKVSSDMFPIIALILMLEKEVNESENLLLKKVNS